MLSPMRAADAFTVSRARWAYRAVFCTCCVTEQLADHRQAFAQRQRA